MMTVNLALKVQQVRYCLHPLRRHDDASIAGFQLPVVQLARVVGQQQRWGVAPCAVAIQVPNKPPQSQFGLFTTVIDTPTHINKEVWECLAVRQSLA